ncbi:hypothetical protein WJX72_010025 [[Myrmecia] bisecta]|uniref:Apple domain-containing protein n=1 Tax=[Myrmecia] bisecta TaxID=41462 RepID=A0AAW1R8K9_9CHLO
MQLLAICRREEWEPVAHFSKKSIRPCKQSRPPPGNRTQSSMTRGWAFAVCALLVISTQAASSDPVLDQDDTNAELQALLTAHGVCVNTNTDPNNCGVCGNVCDPANALKSTCDVLAFGPALQAACGPPIAATGTSSSAQIIAPAPAASRKLQQAAPLCVMNQKPTSAPSTAYVSVAPAPPTLTLFSSTGVTGPSDTSVFNLDYRLVAPGLKPSAVIVCSKSGSSLDLTNSDGTLIGNFDGLCSTPDPSGGTQCCQKYLVPLGVSTGASFPSGGPSYPSQLLAPLGGNQNAAVINLNSGSATVTCAYLRPGEAAANAGYATNVAFHAAGGLTTSDTVNVYLPLNPGGNPESTPAGCTAPFRFVVAPAASAPPPAPYAPAANAGVLFAIVKDFALQLPLAPDEPTASPPRAAVDFFCGFNRLPSVILNGVGAQYTTAVGYKPLTLLQQCQQACAQLRFCDGFQYIPTGDGTTLNPSCQLKTAPINPLDGSPAPTIPLTANLVTTDPVTSGSTAGYIVGLKVDRQPTYEFVAPSTELGNLFPQVFAVDYGGDDLICPVSPGPFQTAGPFLGLSTQQKYAGDSLAFNGGLCRDACAADFTCLIAAFREITPSSQPQNSGYCLLKYNQGFDVGLQDIYITSKRVLTAAAPDTLPADVPSD